MFQKRTLIIVFVIVALGLASGTFFFRSNQTKPPKKVEASSSNATITSQADWDAGSKTNVDSASSPGSIKVSNLSSGTVDMLAIYNNNPSSVTTSVNSSTRSNAIDGNILTAWSFTSDSIPVTEWWKIDLGQVYKIIKVRAVNTGSAILAAYQGSTDDASYSDMASFQEDSNWQESTVTPSVNARYVKVSCTVGGGVGWHGCNLAEFELYAGATAIHTTAPTQIDGGENFWQWETFTDSKTTPANTSVTYRYRTSTNGSDWTAWVGDIGSVTSRTGDDSDNPTKYRYLQIEVTLSNTDGASTPTIDSYTVGYHTNQQPNAPTAMTAVVN